jgi:hypothetical protein
MAGGTNEPIKGGRQSDGVPPSLMSNPIPSENSVAFSFGPEPIPTYGPARVRLAATVRGALDRGIRRLDLAECPTVGPAWSLAEQASHELWPAVTVFLPELSRWTSRAPGPGEVVLLGATREQHSPGDEGMRGLGVRFTEIGAAEAGAIAAASAGARWIAIPGSVLDAPRLVPLARAVRAAGAQVLLTNPHADGRLDGQWLTDGLSANTRRTRPVDFGELERSYAPVLALRFLTEGRRRTLPQAAVAFAFAIGATPSVRFRDLAQVEAFGRPGSVDPLSEDELARVVRI